MSYNNGNEAESQPLLGSTQKDSTWKDAITPKRVVATILTLAFIIGTGVSAGLYIHNREVVNRDPHKAALAILDRYPLIVRANVWFLRDCVALFTNLNTPQDTHIGPHQHYKGLRRKLILNSRFPRPAHFPPGEIPQQRLGCRLGSSSAAARRYSSPPSWPCRWILLVCLYRLPKRNGRR